MPRNITVTFDDGSSHVYQNAPDNITPEQVSVRAQQDFGKPVTHLDGGNKDEAPSLLEGLGRAVATGVPVLGGLANRADAAMDAGLSYGLNGLFSPDQQLHGSFGDRYRQALAVQNGADQAFHEAHPVADTAAQIAGGIGGGIRATQLGLTMAGRFGTGAMTGLSGLAARTGLMGAEGVAVGGADAGLRGNDIGTGAALGGIGGTGGSILGDAAQAASKLFRPSSEKAASIVAKAIADDMPTMQAAQERLQSLGPGAIVADIGRSTRRTLDNVAIRSGDAPQMVAQALTARQSGASSRISNALDTVLGPRTNVLDSADEIAASRAAAARPLYDKAYASEVPMTDALNELLQRPAMQSAMNKAQKLASDAGETFDPSKPTVMGLDYTKRALDDAISSAQRSGNNNESRILIGNKNTLLEHMDNAVPEYAQARRVFSDYSGVAQALQDGQKVFSNTMTPEQLSRTLDGMPYADKQAYLEGARQQITQTMGTARNDANAAKAIFDRGYNREKMAQLIGDDASGWLNRAMDAEKEFQTTAALVGRNSQSGERMLGVGDVPENSTIQSIVDAMGPRAMLARAVNSAMPKTAERTRAEIARLLLSRQLPSMPAQSNAIRNNIANALIGASHEGDR